MNWKGRFLKVIEKEQLDSTNNYALHLGEKGVPEILVVRAEEQTKGKGRRGRRWVSPRGKGLYVSFLLRPKVSTKHINSWTLGVALAVIRVISPVFDKVAIKWPNDIVAEGKKLGGILTEAKLSSSHPEFLVTGIGININNTKDELPPEGTSLYLLTGKKHSVKNIFKLLIREVIMVYRQFVSGRREEMLNIIKGNMETLGKIVKVEREKGVITAEAVDIDEEGALILKEGNKRIRVVSSEITHLR